MKKKERLLGGTEAFTATTLSLPPVQRSTYVSHAFILAHRWIACTYGSTTVLLTRGLASATRHELQPAAATHTTEPQGRRSSEAVTSCPTRREVVDRGRSRKGKENQESNSADAKDSDKRGDASHQTVSNGIPKEWRKGCESRSATFSGVALQKTSRYWLGTETTKNVRHRHSL